MTENNRPHVILQMAASLDGRIAFGPGMTMFDKHPAEELMPDTGPLWRKVEAAIESEWHPAGTLMGSGTVRSEAAPLSPLPAVQGDAPSPDEDFLPEEVVLRTRTWALLVDGRGRCRSGYKAMETPDSHILHLTSRSAPPEYLAFLRRERIPYLIGGEEHADLKTALNKLYSLLGIRAVRLWGGGTLNGAMLRAGLIDEIHLIVWPALIGGSRTPTLADCTDLAPDQQPAVLHLVSAQAQDDGSLWLHYKVARN